jgi:hypothetical protein
MPEETKTKNKKEKEEVQEKEKATPKVQPMKRGDYMVHVFVE